MSDLDDLLGKYTSKPEQAAKPELVLLYSGPGNGKSYLAASASGLPDVGKTLILDIEGSTVGSISQFDAERIDVIRVDKFDGNKFALVNTILQRLETEPTEYGAVVIDTFDVLQDLATKHFATKFKGWDIWAEVGEWSVWAARVLKSIKPVGVLVVHSKETKSDTGAWFSGLNLKGSARDTLPGIPDVVAYLERRIDNDDNKAHTFAYFENDSTRVTKNRFNFPAVVRDPSFPVLWKLIDKKKENN